MIVRMWIKGNTLPLLMDVQTYTATMEINTMVTQIIENLSISSTATSLSGLYTKNAPPYHKEACSIMFIVTLIINPEI